MRSGVMSCGVVRCGVIRCGIILDEMWCDIR